MKLDAYYENIKKIMHGKTFVYNECVCFNVISIEKCALFAFVHWLGQKD